MTDKKQDETSRKPGDLVGNVGEPITLSHVNIHGVSAAAAQKEGKVDIFVRLSLTSDDPLFHKIMPGLAAVLNHSGRQDGKYFALERATTVLLVMHPDNSAELWLDTAAISMQTRVKRSISAGTIIFENDIADISGMWFPLVKFGAEDRILCVFREGWRFGLFFDFNHDKKLSIENAQKELGTLYRRLKYADLYETVSNGPIFARLIQSGWFPFVEIVSGEYKALKDCCEAGFPLDDEEQKLIAGFTDERIERMFERWIANPHFKAKEPILRSALDAFRKKDAIATLKIVLSEIEGLLNDAYCAATGNRTRRVKKLIEFAVTSAEKKAGGADTLLLPAAFAQYLTEYTYADFDQSQGGSAGSRHAVGHGVAPPASYTQVRALQALLTLDQLAFYL